VKPHELVKKLVDKAGGEGPVARAMGMRTFQGTLHKVGAGKVDQPTRATAAKIAKHFKIPIEAIYDEKLATEIAGKLWGESRPKDAQPATDLANAPPPTPAEGFKETMNLSEPESEHIGWIRHLPKDDRDKLFAEVKAVGEKWKKYTAEVLATYRSEGAPAGQDTPKAKPRPKKK
jgi:DNA-binding XRE family transcriptional regulator